jgi:hypothetical protein
MIAKTYGMFALALVPVVAGCVGSGVQRRHPFPRRTAETAAVSQPTPTGQTASATEASPVTPSTAAQAGLAATPSANPAVAQDPTPAAPTRSTLPPSNPPAPQSAAPAPAADALAQLRTLYGQALQTYSSFDGYTAVLHRREQVYGKDKPEEEVFCKFRKQPWSVYFKWTGTNGRGREVIYVQGQHGGLIHTRLAEGDMLFMPAGKQLSLAPNNSFVRSSSRHSITEAGLGPTIEQFGRLLAALEKGDRRAGTLRYLGPMQPQGSAERLEAVEHLIPPGAEPQLSQGGKRLVMFDPSSRLPVLVTTYDHHGHEVEYYRYERIQFPVHFTDDEFNPEKAWKK